VDLKDICLGLKRRSPHSLAQLSCGDEVVRMADEMFGDRPLGRTLSGEVGPGWLSRLALRANRDV
jgi:hypothetical protein